MARRLERFGEALVAISIVILIARFTESLPTKNDLTLVLGAHGAVVAAGAVLAVAGKIGARGDTTSLPRSSPLVLVIGGAAIVAVGLALVLLLLP